MHGPGCGGQCMTANRSRSLRRSPRHNHRPRDTDRCPTDPTAPQPVSKAEPATLGVDCTSDRRRTATIDAGLRNRALPEKTSKRAPELTHGRSHRKDRTPSSPPAKPSIQTPPARAAAVRPDGLVHDRLAEIRYSDDYESHSRAGWDRYRWSGEVIQEAEARALDDGARRN